MKTIKNLFLIFSVLAVLLFNCEPVLEDLFTRQFTMKKGEHYSTPRLVETLQSNQLKFKATFNETAIYDFGDQALQSNKNKLMGFSDCNSLHHENSARFAWQWFNERLEIYAYCYVNGVRTEKFVGVVDLDEENLYEIELTETAYIFRLNNEQSVSMERGNSCDKGIYYMLYPYFGGSIPAPHDVRIAISRAY